MFGSGEIILIIFFVIILFGPNKIPEIFNHLKTGLKQFKQAIDNSK
tara:strand:- start:266 stop:403 length:138 start_codon:yes stop_codon:yes gene_type:complete